MAHESASAVGESDVFTGLFPFPRLMLTRGEGCYVWDEHDKRYLDFTAGIGVVALGHGRRDLGQILGEQYSTLAHVSNLFGNRPALGLAERLVRNSFASRVWFSNSGSEVNESALKFSRLYGRSLSEKKTVFVAFHGGFHGRTYGALSVTYTPAYREPFEPLVPNVRFCKFNDIDALRAVMDDDVCAVWMEPVQGEGGVIPAQPEYLEQVRALCDEHRALLMFDEVQCGMGRTGRLWAHEHYGVTPDIMCLAKPLANGLPIGAVLVSEPVARLLKPGMHGSTFAGGPAVSSVACAVFDIINTPQFLSNVRERGLAMQQALDLVMQKTSLYSGRRGMGLMQALLVKDTKAHDPAAIIKAARAHGLLITRAGSNALRFLPPLVCTDAQISEFSEAFMLASNDVAAGKEAT